MTPYYQDEYATLFCGDCLAVLPQLRAQGLCVDAVITDPPYGIDLANHTQGKSCPGRSDRSYKIEGDKSQEAGTCVLNWCEVHQLPTIFFAHPMKPWPGQWRQYLVWDKGPGVGGGGDVATCWKQSWELLQVARTHQLNGKRDTAVLSHWISSSYSVLHPAQKPVSLLRYLIHKVTDGGATILDPFAGSGTTGVAAKSLGRKSILIEISEAYCEIAAKRLEKTHYQPSLLLEPEHATPLGTRQIELGI